MVEAEERPRPGRRARTAWTALALLAAGGGTACGAGGGGTPVDPPPQEGEGEGVLLVRFLWVGGADPEGGSDAVLLTDSAAPSATGGSVLRHVLVDAGPGPADAPDPSGAVLRRLAALGVDTLEALILTHADPNHFAGVPAVLEGVHVRNVYDNGQAWDDPAYRALLQAAELRAEARIPVDELIDFELGARGATNVRLIPPLPAYLDDPEASGEQRDEGTLAVAVRRGSFTLFLSGDGGAEANARWRTAHAEQTRGRTALGVGRHGAAAALLDGPSSSASAWLDHVGPEVRVVSANGTTHPDARALAALHARGRTFCTHVHGDVTLRVSDSGLHTVAVERNDGLPCTPSAAPGER